MIMLHLAQRVMSQLWSIFTGWPTCQILLSSSVFWRCFRVMAKLLPVLIRVYPSLCLFYDSFCRCLLRSALLNMSAACLRLCVQWPFSPFCGLVRWPPAADHLRFCSFITSRGLSIPLVTLFQSRLNLAILNIALIGVRSLLYWLVVERCVLCKAFWTILPCAAQLMVHFFNL